MSQVIIICLTITAIAQAVFGLVMGNLMNVIGTGDVTGFYINIGLFLLAICLRCIFAVLSQRLIYTDSVRQIEKIRDKLFQNQLKKGRAEDVDIASFTTKSNLVYQDYYLARWNIINNVLQSGFAILAVIYIHWSLVLVLLVFAGLQMSIPVLSKNILSKKAKMYSDESSKYVDSIRDSLNGRLEIVKYGAQEQFINKHIANNEVLEKKRGQSLFARGVANATAYNLSKFTFGVLFIAGGPLVFNGLISVGALMSVVQLYNYIVGPISAIAGAKNQMNSCQSVYEELTADYIVDENVTKITNKEMNNILEVQNVSFKYEDTNREILHNYSVSFENGKKYLIQGESGSGKTTLAKLLSGELTPTEGSIKLYNANINEIDQNQVLESVNYVDQHSYIFKDTLFNNVDFYRESSKDRILEILDSLLLDNLEVDKEISNSSGLSGGQKSRVCLSRSLMDLPDVLIVDEPTAALDLNSALVVMEYLCSLQKTVIVISHQNEAEIVSKFDELLHIA